MENKLKEIIEKNSIKEALNLIGKKTQKLIKSKKRSFLMVSGHNIKHLLKIPSLNADVVILNLEDGVPPEKKEIARVMIGVILSNFELNKEIIIRVNPLNQGGLEDIKFLNQFSFNSFRIPKVNSIKEIEKLVKITDKNISLSIETKESFFNITQFNLNQIDNLFIGMYDLFNELKLSLNLIQPDNPLIHKILSDFSLNTLFIKKYPVGFVYQQYKDLEGFKQWCLLQKNLGIKGVGCITPNQVQIANTIFNDDLEFAKMIVERFEKEGTFTIDGLYVDEPIYKNYLNMLN